RGLAQSGSQGSSVSVEGGKRRRADRVVSVMSPATHFLTGWVLANTASLNRRERALVTLAGVVPDIWGWRHRRGPHSALAPSTGSVFHLPSGFPHPVVLAVLAR